MFFWARCSGASFKVQVPHRLQARLVTTPSFGGASHRFLRDRTPHSLRRRGPGFAGYTAKRRRSFSLFSSHTVLVTPLSVGLSMDVLHKIKHRLSQITSSIISLLGPGGLLLVMPGTGMRTVSMPRPPPVQLTSPLAVNQVLRVSSDSLDMAQHPVPSPLVKLLCRSDYKTSLFRDAPVPQNSFRRIQKDAKTPKPLSKPHRHQQQAKGP